VTSHQPPIMSRRETELHGYSEFVRNRGRLSAAAASDRNSNDRIAGSFAGASRNPHRGKPWRWIVGGAVLLVILIVGLPRVIRSWERFRPMTPTSTGT